MLSNWPVAQLITSKNAVGYNTVINVSITRQRNLISELDGRMLHLGRYRLLCWLQAAPRHLQVVLGGSEWPASRNLQTVLGGAE